MPTYTTDALLAAVRREAFLPDTSDQSDVDLLAFADDALATLISASMVAGRDGRWLAHADVSLVPGTYSYQEPRASLGQTVRGVTVVKPDGVEYPLTETDAIKLRTMAGPSRTSDPWWYAFEAGEILLSGVAPQPGWTLRVFFVRTPPSLITPAEAAQVLGATSSTIIKLATTTPPATISGAGSRVDVVSGQEPYPTVAAHLTVVVLSGVNLETSEFDQASITSAAINRQPDYVVPEGTTVYPPIPRSMWPALVRGTAAAALDAVRDPGAQQMMARAMEARQQATDAIMPRDTRRSRAIVGASALRTTPYGGRRWR